MVISVVSRMDWEYAKLCRLRDSPAKRRQEKDPGLEKVGGECKAGSRTNLSNAEFRTWVLQIEQLLRARPWSESKELKCRTV